MNNDTDLNLAKKKLLVAAIRKLKLEMNGDNKSAAYQLIGEYHVQ